MRANALANSWTAVSFRYSTLRLQPGDVVTFELLNTPPTAEVPTAGASPSPPPPSPCASAASCTPSCGGALDDNLATNVSLASGTYALCVMQLGANASAQGSFVLWPEVEFVVAQPPYSAAVVPLDGAANVDIWRSPWLVVIIVSSTTLLALILCVCRCCACCAAAAAARDSDSDDSDDEEEPKPSFAAVAMAKGLAHQRRIRKLRRGSSGGGSAAKASESSESYL